MLLVVGAITAAANTYRVGNVDIFGVCISRKAGSEVEGFDRSQNGMY